MLEPTRQVVSRLQRADRFFQQQRGLVFLLRAVKFVLGILVLAFLFDVVFHLHAGTRTLVTMIYVTGSLLVLGAWFYIARIYQSSHATTARRLETNIPSLGSALINVLQLGAQVATTNQPPLTRALTEQAITQYEQRMQAVNLRAGLRIPSLGREVKLALMALLFVLAILLALLPITRLEFLRFLDPYGDHPPYSFTQLTITKPADDGQRVIYGRSLIVKAAWSGHEPSELFLTFAPRQHPGQEVTLPMFNKGKLGFAQKIENVKSDLLVWVHTANRHSISRKRRVEVILTPRLKKASLRCMPPAYTGLKPKPKTYHFRNFKVLIGTQVRFSLRSNRPLAHGTIQFEGEDGSGLSYPLATSGSNKVSGGWTVKKSGRLRFTMTDIDGIQSRELLTGSVTVIHDLPPEIAIPFPENDAFVTTDFKFDAQVVADDDYGLRTMRIHRARNRVYSAPQRISYKQLQRHAREIVPFDIAAMGVKPGDLLSLYAEVIDTAPEPHLVSSRVVNLTVISVERYNRFLRKQAEIADIQAKYEQLMNQLQEMLDEQQKLNREIERKRRRKLAFMGKRAREQLDRELAELASRQSELNSKLNKLAGGMEAFVRKKPMYDIEREFQDVLSRLARDIKNSTHQNHEALERLMKKYEAGGGGVPMGLKALRELGKAGERQLLNLRGLPPEIKQTVVDTIRDLSKMNRLVRHFNYFKYLYRQQTMIAEKTRTYNILRNLSRADKLSLRRHAAAERFIRQELERMVKELRRDAKDAQDIFPKAAKSARDLADRIEKARLVFIANRASNTMLIPDGPNSHQLAERLRQEMRKLFSKCNSPAMSGMQSESDTYLRLLLNMNPGSTFGQMSMSRKGWPGQGTNSRGGMGMGAGGRQGSVVSAAPNMMVLGNESILSKGTRQQRAGRSKLGNGQGQGEGKDGLRFDREHVVSTVHDSRRVSKAVSREAILREYSDIVDEYFKAIDR